MDSKTEVMVALGAALGVNCIPCFDHLYTRSKEVGLTDEDVRQICRIADKVKGGAAMFIKQAVIDVAGEPVEADAPCDCLSGGGCC
jgi:hypothetical protein